MLQIHLSIFFLLLYESSAFALKKNHFFGSNSEKTYNNQENLQNSRIQILNEISITDPIKEHRFKKASETNIHDKQKDKNISLTIVVTVISIIAIAIIIAALAACCKKQGVGNSNIGIMTDPKF